ncbi:MAG: hypothetical protein LBU73_06895 [Helicobacteraceae bacterium]|jgi:hypothetical protein|nr:hypothetical protein [Helicobacteraceae bacterium]
MRIAAIFFALISAAFAHRINAHISDENGKVQARAYFTLSTPCRECPVTIVSPNKTITLTTDQEGIVSFAAPSKEFLLKIEGGAGHYAEIEYTLESPIDTNESNLGATLKMIFAIALIAFFFTTVYRIKTILNDNKK